MTALAMLAFAGNSLLARLALADGAIDAAGFTGVRLASGALVLAAILFAAQRRTAGLSGDGLLADRDAGRASAAPAAARVGRWADHLAGSWISALALLVYALAFSLAYREIGAAVGALVLFASVQATMIGDGLMRGEKPRGLEVAGLVLAFGAFVVWIAPTAATPAITGVVAMIVSGVAWGVYSLRGRRMGGDPIRETAGNFIRTVPVSLPLVAASAFAGGLEASGVSIALASGILASGLGYIVWYQALPGLTPTQAAIVQLSVPVLAAFGAILFLGEMATLRFALAAAAILGGIALALAARPQ